MKLSTLLGTIGALALFTAANAQADTVALYPFTGQSLASTDAEINTTASAIALGSGLDGTTRFTAGNNGNPAPALRISGDETDGTTFGTAITDNDFFTFTITPTTGNLLTLNEISFDLAVNSALFNTNVRVQTSIGGLAYTNAGTVSDYATNAFTTETFNLGGLSTVPAGTAISIRFVVFDSVNNANAVTAIDNITVSGTTTSVVPEPGTNALLALGAVAAVGGAAWRRRRANV